ncbi:UDP-glucose 6-dehydrogenase [Candidatus Woesearchaeota archaeon]|jgi:UDPglucose 6-dehydrogenase|nr:UDP-glucose 6-dehydrogenase [Candidatus Woesearchaeota archaeon]
MNISVIGSGYVGLVTGACFATLNNNVCCIDNNEEKINGLNNLVIPIYEEGLGELVEANYKEGRLKFTTDIKEGIEDSEVVFICVGTPPKENGEPDLSAVENVAKEIAISLNGYKLIVEKSTVPVKTGQMLHEIIKQFPHNAHFDIASNPEFLREGSAVYDFMNPDRVVLGTSSQHATAILTELYRPLNTNIIITGVEEAELIKHASNAFLAAKISYANFIANLCEKVGADALTVLAGVGADKRIGKDYLRPGIGYGGFCFPKDLSIFIHIAEENGIDTSFLKAVESINIYQRKHFVEKIEEALNGLEGKILGVLGLSFKPNTDDMRLAPSIDIIHQLQSKKALIKAYDPRAMDNAKNILKDITYCRDPYEVCKDADALLILTEWKEFQSLDLRRIKNYLKNPIIVDGRNMYDPKRMAAQGFNYYSVGRK